MERRSRPAVHPQPRRVAKRAAGKTDLPAAPSTTRIFPNIEDLIASGGDITLGRMAPIDCMATAADQDICYAMLVRRPGETVLELLHRLDRAIERASEDHITIDEVNAPSPRSSMRP